MKFDVPFVGNNHIPGYPEWTFHLKAADWRRFAGAVDEFGYDAIATSEHFAMPYFEVPRLGPYWTHALTVLTFAAGATSRIRLDATVLVMPYHHPLDLAKALSTIDVLSDGRLNVSIGVGHAVREFEVLGIPFAERGARTDEMLAAIKELWTADEPEFHGTFYDIDGLAFEPKPAQKPLPPIYVGGNSKPALRRAARHDGWQPNPTGFSFEEISPLLEYLKQQPEYAGKEATFDVFWLGSPIADRPALEFAGASAAQLAAFRDDVLKGLEPFTAIGITRIPVPGATTRNLDEYLDYLQWFSRNVFPALQS